MAVQQLQKTFPSGLPIQGVGSGNKRENNRDDTQQQLGSGHWQSVAYKQGYGLRRIKKKR